MSLDPLLLCRSGADALFQSSAFPLTGTFQTHSQEVQRSHQKDLEAFGTSAANRDNAVSTALKGQNASSNQAAFS